MASNSMLLEILPTSYSCKEHYGYVVFQWPVTASIELVAEAVGDLWMLDTQPNLFLKLVQNRTSSPLFLQATLRHSFHDTVVLHRWPDLDNL